MRAQKVLKSQVFQEKVFSEMLLMINWLNNKRIKQFWNSDNSKNNIINNINNINITNNTNKAPILNGKILTCYIDIDITLTNQKQHSLKQHLISTFRST